jgi:hypothetical protein
MDMPTGDDDRFELQPSRIGQGRRSWPKVAAVIAAGLAIVIVAALTGASSSAPSSRVGDGPVGGLGSPASTALTGAAALPGSTSAAGEAAPASPRPIPASLACHDLDPSACRLAVATALGTLESDLPAVVSADAWSGVVCGDTLDCPPTRLDGRATPLASVILRLVGGGPAAWINVVYRSHGRPLDFDPTLEAWIARWQTQP